MFDAEKGKTCCFIGSRFIMNRETDSLDTRLMAEIANLYNKGVTNFISGGDFGFDALAARSVLECRRYNKNIRLFMAVAFKNQNKFWRLKDKKIYEDILKNADEITYISEKYSKNSILKRNLFMLEHSNYCLCHITNKRGDTAQTLCYAEENNIYINNLAYPLLNNIY